VATGTKDDEAFLIDLHRAAMGPMVGQIWGWDEAVQPAMFATSLAGGDVMVSEGRGVSSLRFTSIRFCLDHDHHHVVCVQGYGATMDAALADATLEANTWLARQSTPGRL
jgi:hypothetical protein